MIGRDRLALFAAGRHVDRDGAAFHGVGDRPREGSSGRCSAAAEIRLSLRRALGALSGISPRTARPAVRATAVKRWLVEHADIPASRISAHGYGTQPAAANADAAGRARNRRVVIAVQTS